MTVRVRTLYAGLGCLVALWLAYSYSYLEDDGFIHLEFAKNLRDGFGFSFHHRPIYGDSSPLWVAALALVGRMTQLDLFVAAKLLGVVSFVVFAACSHRLQRVQAPDAGVLGACVVASSLLHPFVLTWVFSGMESVGAAAVVAVVMCESADSGSWERRLWRTALAIGVGSLLRLELALLGALAFFALALEARPWNARRLLLLAAAACVAWCPIAAWTVYAKLALGSFVPTTNAAKRVESAGLISGMLIAVVKLAYVLGAAFGAYVLGAALAVWRARAWPALSRTSKLALAWCALLGAFYVVNRTATQTRYVLLLLPAVQWLFAQFVLMRAQPARRRWLSLVPVVALSAYLFAVPVAYRYRTSAAYLEAAHDLSTFVKSSIDPSWPIALVSLGKLGYELPNPIIDLGGLISPDAVRYMGDAAGVFAWARSQGAKCYVLGYDAIPGTRLVKTWPTLDLGWVYVPWRFGTRAELKLRCVTD
jgi:hypothetical protein